MLPFIDLLSSPHVLLETTGQSQIVHALMTCWLWMPVSLMISSSVPWYILWLETLICFHSFYLDILSCIWILLNIDFDILNVHDEFMIYTTQTFVISIRCSWKVSEMGTLNHAAVVRWCSIYSGKDALTSCSSKSQQLLELDRHDVIQPGCAVPGNPLHNGTLLYTFSDLYIYGTGFFLSKLAAHFSCWWGGMPISVGTQTTPGRRSASTWPLHSTRGDHLVVRRQPQRRSLSLTGDLDIRSANGTKHTTPDMTRCRKGHFTRRNAERTVCIGQRWLNPHTPATIGGIHAIQNAGNGNRLFNHLTPAIYLIFQRKYSTIINSVPHTTEIMAAAA